MRLEPEKLPESGLWEYQYAAGELALNQDNVTICGTIEVSGQIWRKTTETHLAGQLKTAVEAECDRCLELVPFTLIPAFRGVYVTTETYAASRQEDLSREDLELLVYDGAAIDLDELVRGEILLALPEHILCRVNCQGLCQHCGANRNQTTCACAEKSIDPRWAALKQLTAENLEN